MNLWFLIFALLNLAYCEKECRWAGKSPWCDGECSDLGQGWRQGWPKRLSGTGLAFSVSVGDVEDFRQACMQEKPDNLPHCQLYHSNFGSDCYVSGSKVWCCKTY